jgi:tetratricopeptide (TPR) repeat protein
LQSRVVNNPQDSNSRNVILEKTQGVFESPLVHPSYIFDAAYFLYGYGFAEKSTEIFQQILEEDPRNLDALNTLAEISERNNQIIKAIEYREQILKLDPWNARNILQLGREYKFVKDFKKMELMRDKILAFASAKSEAQLALTELVR